jgi:hypothetical protein
MLQPYMDLLHGMYTQSPNNLIRGNDQVVPTESRKGSRLTSTEIAG